MKPRGFRATLSGQIGGILLIILVGSILVWTLFLGNFREGVVVGLLFAVPIGLVASVLMVRDLRPGTISVGFQDRDAFLSRLNVAIAKIGYQLDTSSDDLYMYKDARRYKRKLVNISIQVGPASATIVGHSMHVKRLRKLLEER